MEHPKSAAREAIAFVIITAVLALAFWGACNIASNIRQQKPDFNYTATCR